MKFPLANRKFFYLAVFSVIAIVLCIFAAIVYNKYIVLQNVDRNTFRQYEAVRQSRIILLDAVDMQSNVHDYIITGSDAYLAPASDADGRLTADIARLRSDTYYEPHDFANTEAWLNQVEAVEHKLNDDITAVKLNGQANGGHAIAPDKTLADERQRMAGLRATAERSMAARQAFLQTQSHLLDHQQDDFTYILIIGNILAIGLLLAGTVLIIRLESEKASIEDETSRTETRLRTVISGVNDGLYEYNFVSESLYASREFKAMLGYDDDEVDSSFAAATGLIHPDDLTGAMEVRRQYITQEVPVYNNIFRMKHKDGSWRWIMSRGVAQWDKFGQIRTLMGTHTDITEQKNREEELRQLHADMEAFTYITSHDMRSPLVNLKGFSHELTLSLADITAMVEANAKKLGAGNWARLEVILKHDIPESLGFIGNAVDRMDTLTTAILDLSRIGKYVYREEQVDARAILDKCLGAQGYEISSKGAEVTVDPLPELMTDALALEQIFSNLLDNAVKYLRPGVPGRIHVACVETARDYTFSIEDNGRGIDTQDSEKVFYIFRRARNTGDVRGLGLGMAFVKATLRKMGGAIWFTSTVDVGTTFYVRIPKAQAPVTMTGPANDQAANRANAHKTAAAKIKKAGKRMISHFTEPFQMVLIEDDEGHASLIRKNLVRAGVQNAILHFNTGAAALDHFFNDPQTKNGHDKTVVVLDLNLPDIDGFEILRKIKADSHTRTMPVIILSTTDNPKDVDRCYALGCNAFMTKPVGYDDFSDAIQKLGLMMTIVRVPHINP